MKQFDHGHLQMDERQSQHQAVFAEGCSLIHFITLPLNGYNRKNELHLIIEIDQREGVLEWPGLTWDGFLQVFSLILQKWSVLASSVGGWSGLYKKAQGWAYT